MTCASPENWLSFTYNVLEQPCKWLVKSLTEHISPAHAIMLSFFGDMGIKKKGLVIIMNLGIRSYLLKGILNPLKFNSRNGGFLSHGIPPSYHPVVMFPPWSRSAAASPSTWKRQEDREKTMVPELEYYSTWYYGDKQ